MFLGNVYTRVTLSFCKVEDLLKIPVFHIHILSSTGQEFIPRRNNYHPVVFVSTQGIQTQGLRLRLPCFFLLFLYFTLVYTLTK